MEHHCLFGLNARLPVHCVWVQRSYHFRLVPQRRAHVVVMRPFCLPGIIYEDEAEKASSYQGAYRKPLGRIVVIIIVRIIIIRRIIMVMMIIALIRGTLVIKTKYCK